MPGKVYLSGPIAGLSYKGATDWRTDVEHRLRWVGIETLNPMRGKEYLRGLEKLQAYAQGDDIMSTSRAIMTRDRFDCMRADVVLVNLLQAREIDRLSLGTIMEVGWADAKRIPIVCVRAADNYSYHHPMFNEAIGFETGDLLEAVDLIVEILG